MTSHGLNVSTERLETLFWTSRFSVSSRDHHSNVSVSSRSRHHTSRLQPWSNLPSNNYFISLSTENY